MCVCLCVCACACACVHTYIHTASLPMMDIVTHHLVMWLMATTLTLTIGRNQVGPVVPCTSQKYIMHTDNAMQEVVLAPEPGLVTKHLN